MELRRKRSVLHTECLLPSFVVYTLPPRIDMRVREEVEVFNSNIDITDVLENEKNCIDLRRVPRMGLGCFARVHIPMHTDVTFMSGVVRTKAPVRGDHSISLGRLEGFDLTLDCTTIANHGHMRFANHSCDPNCIAVGLPCDLTGLVFWKLRTLRDIAADEQLTYAYGGGFWKKLGGINPVKPGYRLVLCLCAEGGCPNGFARHERRSVC
jgi:SET domain